MALARKSALGCKCAGAKVCNEVAPEAPVEERAMHLNSNMYLVMRNTRRSYVHQSERDVKVGGSPARNLR